MSLISETGSAFSQSSQTAKSGSMTSVMSKLDAASAASSGAAVASTDPATETAIAQAKASIGSGSSASISAAVSKLNELLSSSSDMSASDKAGIQQLLQKAQQAMAEGNLNPEEVANSASDELKSTLQDYGINLASTLSEVNAAYKSQTSSNTYEEEIFNSASEAPSIVNAIDTVRSELGNQGGDSKTAS